MRYKTNKNKKQRKIVDKKVSNREEKDFQER